MLVYYRQTNNNAGVRKKLLKTVKAKKLAYYGSKGVDLTGLLGDIKEDWVFGDPSGVQGRSPGRG